MLLKEGGDNMAKRRPNGEGMIRQKKKGQWEGRIVVGHKSDGKPGYLMMASVQVIPIILLLWLQNFWMWKIPHLNRSVNC